MKLFWYLLYRKLLVSGLLEGSELIRERLRSSFVVVWKGFPLCCPTRWRREEGHTEHEDLVAIGVAAQRIETRATTVEEEDGGLGDESRERGHTAKSRTRRVRDVPSRMFPTKFWSSTLIPKHLELARSSIGILGVAGVVV